jgi:patatin-like phospholipase/acyl hydrolase
LISVQDIDGEDARIADYFDLIAGTSAGALEAAMLVTPKKKTGRPMSALEIKNFFLKHGPEIFHHKKQNLDRIPTIFGHYIRGFFLKGPKYDGMSLRKEMYRCFEEQNVGDTLTNILVMAFDVRRQEPIIFNSYKHRATEGMTLPSHNLEIPPRLLDVCLGSSAAPLFFPAHTFKMKRTIHPTIIKNFNLANNSTIPVREFNLIDGGVAANNPTMAAISSVTQEILRGNTDFHPKVNYEKFLVLSIGTGAVKQDTYHADDCNKWVALEWVSKGLQTPILDFFFNANDALVDYQAAMILRGQHCKENYLRIQYQVIRVYPKD